MPMTAMVCAQCVSTYQQVRRHYEERAYSIAKECKVCLSNLSECGENEPKQAQS